MLKKTITYTNFEGNEVTEDFYFNLTKAEVMKMQLGTIGGYSNKIAKLLGTQSDDKDLQDKIDSSKISDESIPQIVDLFEKLILDSYGKRILVNGHYIFTKEKIYVDEFRYSEAYSKLFMELVENPDSAKKFMESVLPVEAKTVPAVAK